MILAWAGSIESIPNGFHLCDGTNGTPDLRDRFVPGAGSGYDPGDAGGAASHVHPFTGDGHTHGMSSPGQIDGGITVANETAEGYTTGTTDPPFGGVKLPPYYALLYIMKL